MVRQAPHAGGERVVGEAGVGGVGAGGRWRASAPYGLGIPAHARGMGRTGSRRSRCRVCRGHFRADPRAATQKVCTRECRRIWRREQAKQRRADDLEGHRDAERARQQAWRDARRAAPVLPATSSPRVTPVRLGGLSRAGIAPQPHGTKEEILLAWDKASQLSRASLERDLTEILGESASIVGHVGQDRGPVTRWDEGCR